MEAFLNDHIEGWWQNGDERVPIIILGASAGKLLVCRGDTGELTTVPMDRVTLGWRYDFEKGQWVDIDHPEEEDGLGDEPDGKG